MSSPFDPFTHTFDSIDLERARAPTPAAIEHALSLCAPSAAAPEDAAGFYLLDDAGGRFTVDREMGVVTLADGTLLAREANSVHDVRLRVVEPSGACYELAMQLRITGLVPQMVGAEDFAVLAGLDVSALATSPAVTPAAAPSLVLAWSRVSVPAGVTGRSELAGETAPFGAMIATEPPAARVSAACLSLAEYIPAPAPATSRWTL